ERQHYLREISSQVRSYHQRVEEQSDVVRKLFQLEGTKEIVNDESVAQSLDEAIELYEEKLLSSSKRLLDSWELTRETYGKDTITFPIRDKEITMDITTTSLSGLKIPKVAFPKFQDWGERLTWLLKENVPGSFPFTAGVFPFKREGED